MLPTLDGGEVWEGQPGPMRGVTQGHTTGQQPRRLDPTTGEDNTGWVIE